MSEDHVQIEMKPPAGMLLQTLVKMCHEHSVNAGWWLDLGTLPEDHVRLLYSTKLCLIHSEISEAMEGLRKTSKDEHLPQFPSVAVELADALIRIFDLAGALGIPLGEAFVAKFNYNTTRADHKLEARNAPGGKAF